mmetsp:Transcript_40026/g.103600  ORF Transcript_40026/g.103600 Transcript_40026/m.103600 type:complete len:136 (-) Transcript_40026:798-1205(-)
MALAVLRTQRTRSPSPSALLSILPQMAPRAHPSTLAALFAFGATWANASPTSNTTMLSTKLRGGLSAASVAASGTSAVDLGELESATSEMEQLEEKRSEEVPDIAKFRHSGREQLLGGAAGHGHARVGDQQDSGH